MSNQLPERLRSLADAIDLRCDVEMLNAGIVAAHREARSQASNRFTQLAVDLLWDLAGELVVVHEPDRVIEPDMNTIQRKYSRDLRKLAKSLEPPLSELEDNERDILVALSKKDEPLPQSFLSVDSGVPLGTLKKLTPAMTKKGLIQRTPKGFVISGKGRGLL